MPARTTRLVLSFTSPSWISPSFSKRTFGIRAASGGDRFALEPELGEREVLLDVVAIERGGVEQPHLRAHLADLQAARLQLGRGRVLQHDLVAALAVDLVGDDVQVEELDLLVGELVLLAQRRGLLAVDR